MQLKGAEIRNFYKLTADMPGNGIGVKFPKKVKIPHYQRPYKWDSENINKLIDDWRSERGDQYFAGSIVTVNNERKRVHELIDGQQRYTTIFLANYLRFILSRVALRQAVSETSKIIHVTKMMDSYITASKFLFMNDADSDSPLEDELNHLSDLVTSGFDNIDDLNMFSRTKSNLLEFIGLPDDVEESETYFSDHYDKLSEFLDLKDLSLSYDRKSFDKSILSSIKRCCILLNEHKRPKFEVYCEEEVSSEHEFRYLEALKTIFDNFYSFSEKNGLKPFEHAKHMVEDIGRFLEEISLCVVQTGNAEDAYTLFEVLNDRSLALDDLDLIKNQFYKNFVLKNTDLPDKKVDDILQDLDDQWVDRVFSNQGDQKRKLVAYLAIVFITGDTSVVYNRGDGYRQSIQKYLEKLDSYSKRDIEKHFNIFEACKSLIDNAGVRFKSKDLVALESEFDNKSSTLKKAVTFLMAQGQEGVFSGLSNFVLKFIENKLGDEFNFEPVKVDGLIKDFMGGDIPEEVEKQARRVWQISMLSNSADIPRDFAVDLIKHNNIDSSEFDLRVSSAQDKAESEFHEWVNNWRYNSKHLKVKILFARLISMTPNEDLTKLIRKNISLLPGNIGKLQVDHMEANKPDLSHMEKYFDDDERDSFVQGIGNMMPLPSMENNSKGNKPMRESFNYYRAAGIAPGHHLYDISWSLFNENNEDGVPKKEFFQKRKEHLKTLFTLATFSEG